MASIRKRGSSYLLVVSMGYDYEGESYQAQAENCSSTGGPDPKTA